MLPAFFGGTYRKYKEDTSNFIQWLSENGEKCGYRRKDAAFIDLEPVKAPPRLKGKARKLAKKTETSSAPALASALSGGKKQLVQTSELLPLAKAIVASAELNQIEIPSGIIRAGLRAISARKRCTEHFRDVTAADDIEGSRGNQQHSYFTSLMEQVILTLQPCFARSVGSVRLTTPPPTLPTALTTTEESATSPKSTTATSLTSIDDLINRFELLEVEEPSENTGEFSIQPEVAQPVYELVVPAISTHQIEEEKLFAIFCLFYDLHELQHFLAKLWSDYLVGDMDLISASVTTNMAFQLAIRTQEEMLVTYPECKDYQNILSVFVDVLSKQQGVDDDIEMDEDFAEWIYAPAHSILDSFCDVIRPGTVPRMKRGYFGIYNPMADRSRMDTPHRQQEDKILLVELLPEFCVLSQVKGQLFTTDELTRGLSRMCTTKEIPVWLTFATSVLLDIHHTLREKAGRAFTEVQTIGNRACETLNAYFDLAKGLKSPSTWPKKSDEHLQKISKKIEATILKDSLLTLKSSHSTTSSYSLGEEERFYLFKRHPVLCGLLAFRTILELQEAGHTLVNAWGTVVYPAHLYNALRQRDPLLNPWSLMDQALDIHGNGQVFVGAAPTTLEASFKQITLMMGYSVTQFSRNQRRPGLATSPNGPRGLKDSLAVANLFKDAFGDGGSAASMSTAMHKIEQLLSKQAVEQAMPANQKRSVRPNPSTLRTLTPLNFLQVLRTSLTMEMPGLTFDYFELHKQSITFLRRLRTACDDDFRKVNGPTYIDNESQLPFLAGYVVMIACGSEKKATALGFDESAIYIKILEKAGETLGLFLEDQKAASIRL